MRCFIFVNFILMALVVQSALASTRVGRFLASEVYSVYLISHGRKVIQVEISSEVQKEIDALFVRPESMHFINVIENNLVFTGALTSEEVAELRALRQANKIFEMNTVLRADKGGWEGNYFDLSNEVRTWCAEEAKTYIGFIHKLEERGVLKYFQVEPDSIVRLEWGFLNNHAAVQLRNKRTREIFIYDSWFDDGGEPARIFTEADWLNRNNEAIAVDLP